MTRVNRPEQKEPPPRPPTPVRPREAQASPLAREGFDPPKFQSPSQVAEISEKLAPKHGDRRMGSDPKTETNCSIYTFDVIKTAVERDGGKLDSTFQLQWMNAVDEHALFNGKDKNSFGPANALRSSRLGYMVGNIDGENFDDASKKFMKGDFVQLQGHGGGHQGVLTGWGREENGRPYLEIRGFQRNPDTGWIDVNVKRAHLYEADGYNNGYEYDRAIVARYDPNETYKPRPKIEIAEPKSFRDTFEIAPLKTSDLIGHLRLR